MRRMKDGALILSRNHIRLLGALGRCPNGIVRSRGAWYCAVGFDPRQGSKSLRTLPAALVESRKVESRIAAELTPLGRAVLEMKEPTCIWGYGMLAAWMLE